MLNVDWVKRSKDATFSVFNFIDGNRKALNGGGLVVKHSPRDGGVLYQLGAGTTADADAATSAAKKAFDDGRWRRKSVHERAAIISRLASLIEDHAERLALYETMDVGKPIHASLNDDIGRSAQALREAASLAPVLSALSGVDGGALTYQLRTPLGIVAAIVGWNFPLTLTCSKIGPALMMGNSVVLKPSEFASLSACSLAELALEAGVPEGVFNVVCGLGTSVGDCLARHPDIRLLSFTGSSATGKQLMVASGQSNMKRLILECGGKSPFLVFDDFDGDLDALASTIVNVGFRNQGALCVSATRVLIQSGIRNKLLPLIVEKTEAISPGDPLDPKTRFGAIMSEAHMKKVQGYVQSGLVEGARLICGGEQVRNETGGYYLTPALFDQVDPASRIAKEEVFGPLVSLFSFEKEGEGISLANDSEYGLAAYAATSDARRIQRLGRDLEAGVIQLFSNMTPEPGGVSFGVEPLKQSGFGIEGGVNGLAAFSQCSAVMAYA